MNQDDVKQLQQAGYTDTHIQILSGLPEAIFRQFMQHLETFKKTKRQPETFIFFLKEIAAIEDMPKDFNLQRTINIKYGIPYQRFLRSLKVNGHPDKYIQELHNFPLHLVIILLRKYDVFLHAHFSFSEILISLVGSVQLNLSDLLGAEKRLLQLIAQIEKDPTFKAEHIRSTLTNCLTRIFRQINIEPIWLNNLVASIIENDISYEILWLLKNKFPIQYFLHTSTYHLDTSKIQALFIYYTPLKTLLNLDDATIFSIVSLKAGQKRLEQVANSIDILKRYELPKQQIIDLFTGYQDDTFFEGATLAARLLLTIPEEHSSSFCAIEDTDERLNVCLSNDPYPPKKKQAYHITFFSQAGLSEKPANQNHSYQNYRW